MVRAAVIALAPAGVKCPWSTQLAPAARADPQEFGKRNDDALTPVTTILAIIRAALPVLVNVTFCGALAVSTSWGPNDRLVADTDVTGALPLSEMLCVA
jgi:hypothetical protein